MVAGIIHKAIALSAERNEETFEPALHRILPTCCRDHMWVGRVTDVCREKPVKEKGQEGGMMELQGLEWIPESLGLWLWMELAGALFPWAP